MVPRPTYFARHAEAEVNISNWHGPNHSSPLTKKGAEQAKKVASSLEGMIREGRMRVGRIWHSTYKRSRQTGEIVFEHLQQSSTGVVSNETKMVESSLLNEKHDGPIHDDWEGKGFQTPKKYWQNLQKVIGWYHFRAPGGENGPDVEGRIYRFHEVLSNGGKGHIQRSHDSAPNYEVCDIVVAHGNWLWLQRKLIENIGYEECEAERKSIPIPNASITLLEPYGNNYKIWAKPLTEVAGSEENYG